MRAAVMTEFSAPLRVEEVGLEVRDVAPGDRVVCTWMTACGACWFCRRGESRLCEEHRDVR